MERGVQSVEGQVRVLEGALEGRWGIRIGARHMVLPWVIEYAAHLLNRFEVGHDGKTAYERCKGKQAKSMGIEFGEGVLWRRKPAGGAAGKLTVLWNEGVYLGVKGRTGEFVVGDAKGVWKTRTIQRTPVGSRWTQKNAELITGVPWNTGENDAKADGDKLEVIKFDPQARDPGGVREQFGDIPIPRRVKISKGDLATHGYTANCEGCKAAMAGRPQRPHSDACRKRMESLMKDDPKTQKARKRQNEFFDKVVEEQDKQDQEEKDKRRKRDGEASSSSSGQLALPGAEKRKSNLSEGEVKELHAPPQKGPKIQDKKGTKRGS